MSIAFATDPASRAIFAGRLRRVAAIVVLMGVSAVTEGLGLLLFVPLLSALGGSQVHSRRLGALFAALHVPTGIGALLALFVLLAAARAGINFARDMAQFTFRAGVVHDLRGRAWDALVRCDWRTLAGMRRSEGAGLMLTEVDRVGVGVEQMFVAVGAVLTLAGLGIAAMVIAPAIALGAVTLGAVALVSYRGIQRRTRQLGDKYGDAVRLVRAEFDEGLAALRVIKSFGQEDRAIADGAAASGALRRVEGAFYRNVGFGSIVIQGGGAAVLAVLVWAAVTYRGAGAEMILPVVAIAMRALPLLPVLHHCWQNWMYARPAMLRVLALIDTAEAAREPDPGGIALPPVRRAIVLRDITVRYAARDRPALDAITLTLPANRITALIGASGSGKSTLADVLGGLLVPDAGTIAIDGAVLSGPALRDWRRQVTYVQQDPWLFPGTIRANLLWAAPEADEAQLRAALQLAAADFVAALPAGLDTVLGDNGRALSGGERQRIVLARALLRAPELLILDEATSALDAAAEAAIADAVAALRERMTILVIGHRGRLCELADHTIIMDGGRIGEAAPMPAVPRIQ